MTATIEDLEDYANEKRISFEEAMSKYDLVDAVHDPVHGNYVIMSDRNSGLTESNATRELGYASPSPWTSAFREERVPELFGRQGLRTYYDMKRADGTVRGALRLIKTPVLAARWFVEPASESSIDRNIADFVQKNLFEELSVPWSRVVEDALLMCDYGFMPFEYVFEREGKYIKLQKLAPRHPMDIIEWLWDFHGGPAGVLMDQPTGFGGTLFWDTNNAMNNLNMPSLETYQGFDFAPGQIFIPIEKMMIFVLEQEAGDLRGISILRSAYKHYYFKDVLYKIDAIQKERHGIGVPIIKLPVGFSKEDRLLADDLGRNLRTNERAHIVVPSNWEIMFAKLEGQPVDCLTSIEHHDKKIMSNILAAFMDQPKTGSATEPYDVFYKSTRYIANTICDTFNHFLIPQLVKLNFSRGGNPKLRVRRIGEWDDIRTMSFAFRNFVGANAIIPDDRLEKFLRQELDLPAADESTKREPQQKGAPQGADANVPNQPNTPKVGLPRQAKPSANAPKLNTGRDSSGG